MASNVNTITRAEIEDPPITNRSGIWHHFGLPVSYECEGKRVEDKKQWYVASAA